MSSEQLPSGWASACLSDLASLNPGLGRCILDESHPVTFVPMAAVAEGFGGIVAPETRPYGEVKKGYTPFVSGDVIFAKITPCMENGKGGVVKGTQDDAFFGSTEFHVVRPRGGVQAAWLASYLSQESLRRAARLKMKGSAGQLRVPEEFLAELQVPLPPAAEQTRIADRIDELFSDLDSGVEALRRVRRKLDRYRAAVLHAAVTGRLSARWREEHAADTEPAADLLARILKARREHWEAETLRKYEAKGKTPPKGWRGRYKEPNAPVTEGLPALPASWVWVAAEQLGFVQLGRQRSPKNRSAEFPTPYVRAANLTEQGLDLSDVLDMEFRPEERDVYQLAPGDLLLSEASGSASQVGKPVMWRGELDLCCFQNTVIRLRPCEANGEYLLLYFKHCYTNHVFSNLARGVGIHHLSAGKLSPLPIALPPSAEQDVIIAEAESQLCLIDTLEAEVDRTLRRSGRLRQSILKAAFEGKLVPQDSEDEPASALLERLTQEAGSTPRRGHRQSRAR